MSEPPHRSDDWRPGYPSLPERRQVPLALLALAGPAVATMISRTVMSFVDFVMVSQLGVEAQAAIFPAQVVLFGIVAFGIGLVSVVNSFVAQALGRNQPRECAAFGWQGLWLSLGLGVAILPAWFVFPVLFGWVGHEPTVQALEIEFARIALLSMGPALGAMALSNFFNGIHKPSVAFWTGLIANGLNVLANYVLIFGMWGFPELGMAGAAWATVIAGLVHVLVLLAWMLRPRMQRIYRTREAWRPSRWRLRQLVRVGSPAGVQMTLDIAAFGVFTLVIVGQFGKEQLAASNLAFKFLEMSFMPTVGLGVAVTAAVGKAVGQGRPDLARLVARWGAGFATVYMGAIALLYVTIPQTLAGVLSDEPAVVGWAGRILLVCAIYQVLDAFHIIFSHALRGAGDTFWPAVMSVCSATTMFIGMGWLISSLFPAWGVVGPWIAATMHVSLMGLMMVARWRSGAWRRIELGRQPEGEALADQARGAQGELEVQSSR